MRPPEAAVTESVAPETGADVEAPPEPMPGERDAAAATAPEGFSPAPTPENKLIWLPAIGSALVAGMLATVGTLIPSVPLALLCMFASGGLAVTLYRRRAGVGRVTAWMGAKLGVLAGSWGFGMQALFMVIVLLSASGRTKLRETLMEKMKEAAISVADPNAARWVEQFRGFVATDHGLIVITLVGATISGVLFLSFSALGGALGAALFGGEIRRKET